MKLTFLGAAGEVTGSATLLQTPNARVLVDFGIHQGDPHAQARNARFPAEIDPARLDAVVLTHAHLDHSGRLPLLVREGYKGPIWATPATIELCDILLRDSAAIQESDADRLSRSRARTGREPVHPLYTAKDVEATMTLFRALPYDNRREVAPAISCRFVDAGHILGSASAELTITSASKPHIIAFSGDIGVKGAALLRDPVPFSHADTLVLESTYGDRDHRPLHETLVELTTLLADCRTCNGKTLIPAFAVGRTQNLIYFLADLHRKGRLDHPAVYIDSPMAIESTELYRRHRDLFDDAARALIDAGDTPLKFPGLRFTRTADESRALNNIKDHAIIIAGAGMMTGGRILHHLRHNLWKTETTLLIVGYQGKGTIGRQIVDGAKSVRIMGESVAVKATVHTLGGLSAHAGQSELIRWTAPLQSSRPRVILNHGEDPQRHSLSARLRSDLALAAELPAFRDTVDLAQRA